MLPGRASTFALATVCALALPACGKASRGETASPAASVSAPLASAPLPSVASEASAAPSAAAPASASARAPVAPRRHHVSLAGVLLTAAYELPLTDDQKTQLDAADAPLYPDGAPSPWTAVRRFQADLVAGIRLTRIDLVKLKADEAMVDKAVADGEAAEAVALNTLHGLLDAATRKALVDLVKGKLPAKDAKAPASPPEPATGDFTERRLELLTSALDLDDTQRKLVATLLAPDASASSPAAARARRDAEQRRLDALLAAFPRDAFDARNLDLSGPAGRAPHERFDRAAVFARGLVPILRLGQLARFAEQTERAGRPPERILDDVGRSPAAVAPADSHG
jgi:hypothetical protein